MSSPAGPLHETNFGVADAAQADFEAWLEAWVRDATQHDAVVDARPSLTLRDDHERLVYNCQFRLRDNDSLDDMLSGFFSETAASVVATFGDDVALESRSYREDLDTDLSDRKMPNCLNCGVRLRGQYCGNCGQRAVSRLISLWELTREAFGDLIEVDSRLWRTLRPLLRNPGLLTKEYLEGRRARYMPPFRMYLVLSVVFFVIAFFDPRDDLSLLFEPEPDPATEEVADTNVALTPPDVADEETDDNEFGIVFTDDGTTKCQFDADEMDDMPEWLQRRITPERMQSTCQRLDFDQGKTFGDLILDNVPIALIVLLPLMAVVLKILYPLSRRYFVEHLLFCLHFHSFFFLILILLILFARFMALLPLPEIITALTLVAASIYIPIYLYIAMRRVYGQGHLLTVLKFTSLASAYVVGASLTLLGAVLFAFLSY